MLFQNAKDNRNSWMMSRSVVLFISMVRRSIHVQYTSTKPPQCIAMIKFTTNTSSSWWIFYSLWFGLEFYFISVFPFIVNKNVMNYSECSVLLGHINIILIKWVLNIDELNGLCRNWITNWNQNKLKSWFLLNIKFVYCCAIRVFSV